MVRRTKCFRRESWQYYVILGKFRLGGLKFGEHSTDVYFYLISSLLLKIIVIAWMCGYATSFYVAKIPFGRYLTTEPLRWLLRRGCIWVVLHISWERKLRWVFPSSVGYLFLMARCRRGPAIQRYNEPGTLKRPSDKERNQKARRKCHVGKGQKEREVGQEELQDAIMVS